MRTLFQGDVCWDTKIFSVNEAKEMITEYFGKPIVQDDEFYYWNVFDDKLKFMLSLYETVDKKGKMTIVVVEREKEWELDAEGLR